MLTVINNDKVGGSMDPHGEAQRDANHTIAVALDTGMNVGIT